MKVNGEVETRRGRKLRGGEWLNATALPYAFRPKPIALFSLPAGVQTPAGTVKKEKTMQEFRHLILKF